MCFSATFAHFVDRYFWPASDDPAQMTETIRDVRVWCYFMTLEKAVV